MHIQELCVALTESLPTRGVDHVFDIAGRLVPTSTLIDNI